MLKFIKNDTNK
jgi:chromosome segregation ATPase